VQRTPPGALKARIQAGEHVVGTFLNLGSPLATEICSTMGMDWVLLDLEHGAGPEADLLAHAQATGNGTASLLVRVEANDRPRFARALDIGAAGVMVPRVETAEEAATAISSMQYPPVGTRGVALGTRAARFGVEGFEPIHRAGSQLLGVIQIESERAVSNVDAIAAVPGVDVLFVGPADLTFSMGIPGQTRDPRFVDALEKVNAAARRHHKAAGFLMRSVEELDTYIGLGYTFLGISTDSGVLASGMRALAAGFRQAVNARAK
jgi:2-keto-3-deoxy-L-rhamnonate aldolase RhmA